MQDITNRQEYAISLRNRGYNCAQCVLMALANHIGMDESLAARISAAYGTGFGGSGEMCGAISIIGVAEGMMVKGSEPQDKSTSMWRAKDMLDKFKEENGGRFLCRDLKGKDPTKKCPDLIKDAIRMFMEEHPTPQVKGGLFAKIKSALSS